jgi:hypothetical protein
MSRQYISWADTNRKNLAKYQGGNGIFSPAVNPLGWTDRTKYTSGSPEGQAFTVYLYTAYRDCVGAGICSPPATASTISVAGIGPFDYLTVLVNPISFSAAPAPTGVACGAPQSCDANSCHGQFNGLVKYPTCTDGPLKGCQCIVTPTVCGESPLQPWTFSIADHISASRSTSELRSERMPGQFQWAGQCEIRTVHE